MTVTPSKPLTPSHLKGLLWTDVMYRATALRADVRYRYSPTTYHLTEQTLGFWEYLDRVVGAADYTDMSEQRIGELYMAFRAVGARPPVPALSPYATAVERTGWVHPAAERVLRLWQGHYERLGLHDPGLTRHQPPALDTATALLWLTGRGLCLDHRDIGGPVYLDATRHGLPLRTLISADGLPNYLMCALRELIPLVAEHDETVLLFDRELAADYLLLDRVLARAGVEVRRVPVSRVPVDGVVRSARYGGWDGHTAGALLDEVLAGYPEPVARLGVRLYFIAVLGPGGQQSFRRDLLVSSLERAARLLEQARPAGAATLDAQLDRARGDRGHVDPYRLTAGLLRRHGPAPATELLAAVYL